MAPTNAAFAGATQVELVTEAWTMGVTPSADFENTHTITIEYPADFDLSGVHQGTDFDGIGVPGVVLLDGWTGAFCYEVFIIGQVITLAFYQADYNPLGINLPAGVQGTWSIAGIANPTAGSYPGAGFIIATPATSSGSSSPASPIVITAGGGRAVATTRTVASTRTVAVNTQAAAYIHAITPAPSGEWKLGESSGSALDTSGSGNNGTVTLGAGARHATALDNNGDGGLTYGVGTLVSVPSAAATDNIFDGGGCLLTMFVCPTAGGEGGTARLMDKSSTILRMVTATRIILIKNFSGTNGQWQFDNDYLVAGKTYALAILYNDSGTGDPTMYLWDIARNTQLTLTVGTGLTRVAAPVGTRVTDAGTAMAVGNRGANDRSMSAEMDEFRIWNGAQPTIAQLNTWFAYVLQQPRGVATPRNVVV